jgi:hypothetical protein
MMRLLDGVTLNTLPIRCKPVPLSKNMKVNVNVHLKFSILRLFGSGIRYFFAETLFNEKCRYDSALKG